jgi:hypothetical protein
LTTTSTTQTRGLRHKVHTDWFDFCPGYEKQQACYKSAVITETDPKYSKKGKGDTKDNEPRTWPYLKSVEESLYESWVERVTNKKNQFNPQKDEDNRTIPNTGAYRTIRSITRIKRADDSEYLITKSDLHGFDSLGEEVRLYASSSCDKWIKQNFIYKTEWDNRSKQLEKQLQGTGTQETIYEIPFSKEAAKELYDKRESDKTIQFLVKEEETGKAMQVRDLSGSASKSFELFRDTSWDDLFKANYIPQVIKSELKQEAIAQGLIQGGTADYQATSQPQQGPSGKGVYK